MWSRHRRVFSFRQARKLVPKREMRTVAPVSCLAFTLLCNIFAYEDVPLKFGVGCIIHQARNEFSELGKLNKYLRNQIKATSSLTREGCGRPVCGWLVAAKAVARALSICTSRSMTGLFFSTFTQKQRVRI
jgi:hypothetical protein